MVLTCYLADGDLPIDNNWVEKRIRPIALWGGRTGCSPAACVRASGLPAVMSTSTRPSSTGLIHICPPARCAAAAVEAAGTSSIRAAASTLEIDRRSNQDLRQRSISPTCRTTHNRVQYRVKESSGSLRTRRWRHQSVPEGLIPVSRPWSLRHPRRRSAPAPPAIGARGLASATWISAGGPRATQSALSSTRGASGTAGALAGAVAQPASRIAEPKPSRARPRIAPLRDELRPSGQRAHSAGVAAGALPLHLEHDRTTPVPSRLVEQWSDSPHGLGWHVVRRRLISFRSGASARTDGALSWCTRAASAWHKLGNRPSTEGDKAACERQGGPYVRRDRPARYAQKDGLLTRFGSGTDTEVSERSGKPVPGDLTDMPRQVAHGAPLRVLRSRRISAAEFRLTHVRYLSWPAPRLVLPPKGPSR